MGDAQGEDAAQRVPYFWSDQFGLRLQCYGRPEGFDQSDLVWGSFEEERFAIVYRRRGAVVGVAGVNAAREVRQHRAEIEAGFAETQALSSQAN